jgi:hypothetical protein
MHVIVSLSMVRKSTCLDREGWFSAEIPVKFNTGGCTLDLAVLVCKKMVLYHVINLGLPVAQLPRLSLVIHVRVSVSTVGNSTYLEGWFRHQVNW